MTGPEYLAFLRAGGARGADTANALRLIDRVQSGRLRNNSDVIDLCRSLAKAMNLGDIEVAHKPPKELYYRNEAEYHRLYMRWYRQNGQAGEGRGA
jgi:hypothetical protein